MRKVLKDVLMESNVHLLAKLVPKITATEAKEGVSSEEIFAAYILKTFWHGHKKVEEGEVCVCLSDFLVRGISSFSQQDHWSR